MTNLIQLACVDKNIYKVMIKECKCNRSIKNSLMRVGVLPEKIFSILVRYSNGSVVLIDNEDNGKIFIGPTIVHFLIVNSIS